MKLLDLFAFSGLMNFIFALFWGLMVFLKERTEAINRVFVLLSLCVAFWSLSYYFWLSATSYQGAYLGVILLTLFSILIPVIFYHWVLLLIDFYNNKQLKLIIYIFLNFIILFFRKA